MRRLAIIAVVLVLAGCAGYLAGCAEETATRSPIYPSPSPMRTELPQMPRLPATATPTPGPVFLPRVSQCACTCEPIPTPTPAATPTATLDITLFDCQGQISTTWWLTSTFGDVSWSEGSLAELRCSVGPAVLVANVRDPDGQPVENATVILWWLDAPFLPPELQSCGLDRGVFGPTNQNGDIGFGLGQGSYYFPPSGGPHVMWVAGGKSCLSGLGMLGGTEHQHLDSGWQLSGDQVKDVGSDWGYSKGAVVWEQTVSGRRMWVIRVP